MDREYPDSWTDRLGYIETEMAVIEEAVSTDHIEVKTYLEKTVVTLTYSHEEEKPTLSESGNSQTHKG